MKGFLKILLIVLASATIIIIINSVIHSEYMKPFIDRMDAKNKSRIDQAAQFAEKSVPEPIKEYSNLFNGKIPDFIETLTFVDRRPISKFLYQNNYYIQVSEIDNAYNINLEKAVKQRIINSKQLDNVNYALDHSNGATFYYNNSIFKTKINNIVLSLDGGQNHSIVQNDSVTYYYSKVKNFSIQFNDDRQDLLAVSGDDVSMEILFLKRKMNLYLLILTCKDASIPLDYYTLYNLVKFRNK